MRGLSQEVADTAVGQVVTVLRAQTLIDDGERPLVYFLKQAVKELVLNNHCPLDRFVIGEGASQ